MTRQKRKLSKKAVQANAFQSYLSREREKAESKLVELDYSRDVWKVLLPLRFLANHAVVSYSEKQLKTIGDSGKFLTEPQKFERIYWGWVYSTIAALCHTLSKSKVPAHCFAAGFSLSSELARVVSPSVEKRIIKKQEKRGGKKKLNHKGIITKLILEICKRLIFLGENVSHISVVVVFQQRDHAAKEILKTVKRDNEELQAVKKITVNEVAQTVLFEIKRGQKVIKKRLKYSGLQSQFYRAKRNLKIKTHAVS